MMTRRYVRVITLLKMLGRGRTKRLILGADRGERVGCVALGLATAYFTGYSLPRPTGQFWLRWAWG